MSYNYDDVGYTEKGKGILRAWGHFLNETPWTCFCTFTTHYKLKKKRARKVMEQMTAQLLEKYTNSFRIFWVAEPHADKQDFHVHALIKIDATVVTPKQSLTEAWHKVCYPSGYRKTNLVDVQDYEAARGGQYYVAKYLQKEEVDYDIH